MQFISDSKLRQILCASDLMSEKAFDEAAANAHLRHRAIEEVLLERSLIAEQYLLEIISDHFEIPYVNLRTIKVDHEALNRIPEKVALVNFALAYKQTKRKLYVAMANPKDTGLIEDLEELTGMPVIPRYSLEKHIKKSMRFYKTSFKEDFEHIIHEQSRASAAEVGRPADNASLPIITIVNKILEYAVVEDASDIHIEPMEDGTVIRFRLQGLLRDMIELPSHIHSSLVTRVKIMANIKIDEHYRALDGRFGFTVMGQNNMTRVSIIPTYHGEKVVLRILKDEGEFPNLGDLGFDDSQSAIVHEAVERPHGLILVVGPTGSGKSTTLYFLLRLLNEEQVNISTIEDPIESDIRRINQSQVNATTGYTFAGGLRALLRQDPDVIMVGEIRDTETSSMVIQSALTGHLVLSTLHTKSSVGVIPRLREMGEEPYLIASTLNLIISQRLVRRICPDCIQSHAMTVPEATQLGAAFDSKHMLSALKRQGLISKTKKSLAGMQVYEGKGCDFCGHTGYLGRIGVYEVLQITDELRSMITEQVALPDLQTKARASGMQTLLQNGIEKVFAGQTTMTEILRILKE